MMSCLNFWIQTNALKKQRQTTHKQIKKKTNTKQRNLPSRHRHLTLLIQRSWDPTPPTEI